MLVRKGTTFICCGGLILVLFMIGMYSTSSAAPGPLAVIQSGTDRALQILRTSQAPGSQKIQQRRGEILTIVDDYFSFQEMARRALGRPWKDQPQPKQQEFVKLFKELLFNTYVGRVENYTGSNERVLYDGERIEGEYALVKTRVMDHKGTDVRVDYKLRQIDGEWKVYDVVVEGISFIDNYRSQFSSILNNEPFDALLNRLRQKVKENASL